MSVVGPSPDTFGSTPTTAPRLTDPSTGVVWTLGFAAPYVNGVPTVVWTAVSTWAAAKTRLGPTWATAKRYLTTWGAAKSVVGS